MKQDPQPVSADGKQEHFERPRPALLPPTGVILLAGISLFWGFSWPSMKIALNEIPPWIFRTFCLALGGAGLLTMAKAGGHSLRIPLRVVRPLCFAAILNITLWHLGTAYGVMLMNAGRAAIIAFTMPVWASLLSRIFLGERLTWNRLVGLLLGLAGLAVLIAPDLEALHRAPLGALCMLAAAISWAGGTVYIKRVQWTIPPTLFTGWMLILGGIPIFVGAGLLESPAALASVSWPAVAATVYLILFPMIYCYWAWFKVVGLFPANVAAISTLAIPVIGVFSSALILGESVGLREIAALLLVVTALALVLIRSLGRR
jgi:drug/metabolite transporter (DMT)-like permease